MGVHDPKQVAEATVQNVLSEDPISLKQAAQELEAVLGKRMSRATIHRWVQRGTRGHKLDAARVGNEYYTSRPALNRFIVGMTVGN